MHLGDSFWVRKGSKLVQVTHLVLVSITLLLYTLHVKGNVQFILFYVVFFHCICIYYVITQELTYCSVYLKLNDYVSKGVSLRFIS